MIYLYVPFDVSESNKKLMMCATQWSKTIYGNTILNRVLSCNEFFNKPDSPNEKTKIYIIAYESADDSEKMISSSLYSSLSNLNLEKLVSRLLSSKLPDQGLVEIKLCVKQSGVSTNEPITAESIKTHLLNKNYINPNLTVNVRYSTESFPGEIDKKAYHSITGGCNFPLFTKQKSDDDTEEDAAPQKNNALGS